jgi:hypothetical protein
LFLAEQLFFSEHFALFCLSFFSIEMADPAQNNQLPPPPPPQQQQQQQQQQPLVNPLNQPANNVPIVQAQVVQGADGGMAVKVQQTKLPEFWSQKDKDSISANEFVKRVDKMSANN